MVGYKIKVRSSLEFVNALRTARTIAKIWTAIKDRVNGRLN